MAFAMLLLIEAAFLMSGIGTGTVTNLLRAFAAGVLLFIGLGTYQALAVYYIAVCLVFFLAELTAEQGAGRISPADSLDDRTFRCGVSVLSLVYEHVSGVFGLYGQPDGLGKTACARMYQECAAHAEKSAARPWTQKFFVLRMRRGASACAGRKRACLPEKTGTSVGRRRKSGIRCLDWRDWCLRRCF